MRSGVDPNVPTGPYKGGWKFWNIFLEQAPDTPLAVACGTGNLQMVKMLLSYGASPAFTQHENLNWSALCETLFYFQKDDEEIVKLLLENGINPYCKEYYNEKPVFMAAKMTPKVYDATKVNGTVFLTEYDEETAKGITEIVILLLGNDSVNITTLSGQTLLMFAAQKGNLYLVNYLLAQGCDIAAADLRGRTAYDYAVENGYGDIAELLQ